jgi:ABC-type histidine transport system ATPase subunit
MEYNFPNPGRISVPKESIEVRIGNQVGGVITNSDQELETLSAPLTLWIGEIAVERKMDVLNEGIDAEMQDLGRLATFSDMIESAIKLRQILNLNH